MATKSIDSETVRELAHLLDETNLTEIEYDTGSVRIAAMRVVRPLPFTTEPQPMVKDFLPELANVLKTNEKP